MGKIKPVKVGNFTPEMTIRKPQALVLSDHALLRSDLASAIIRIMPYPYLRVWEPVLIVLEMSANSVYEYLIYFC